MNCKKKYLREVKKNLVYVGKREKMYLKEIKRQINDYDSDSYEQLIAKFGVPEEITDFFYTDSDREKLIKEFRKKKRIFYVLSLIVIILCIYLIILYVDYKKSQNAYIDREIEYIIEIKE